MTVNQKKLMFDAGLPSEDKQKAFDSNPAKTIAVAADILEKQPVFV